MTHMLPTSNKVQLLISLDYALYFRNCWHGRIVMTKAQIWRNICPHWPWWGFASYKCRPENLGHRLKEIASRSWLLDKVEKMKMTSWPITSSVSPPEMLMTQELKLNRYSYHLIKQGKCTDCEHCYYAVLMRLSLKPCQAFLLPTHAIQDRHWVKWRLQFSSRKCYKIQEILISAAPTALLLFLLLFLLFGG